MKRKVKVIDADYSIEREQPEVRLYCKTSKGENLLAVDRDFSPYFYAIPVTGLDDLEEKLKSEQFTDKNGEDLPITKIEKVEKKDENETVEALKVYTTIPPNVPKIEKQVYEMPEVSECREYDIPFYKRYLIDKGFRPMETIEIKGEEEVNDDFDLQIELGSVEKSEGNIELNELAFDLEVYEGEVIMASIASENYGKLLTTKKIGKDFAEYVESEKKLLERFIQIIQQKDADIVSGYNTDEYDFQKLRERCEEHNIELSLGRDGERMKFRRRGRFSGARLKGRMHLDLYPFIEHILAPGIDSETLDLDSVAQEMLGREKDEMNWEEMKKAWEEKKNLEEFADYALKDAKLAYQLAQEIVPQMLELSRITGLTPFDTCRLTYGQLTENYLLREAHERNMISPNRPTRSDRRKRQNQGDYSGGFVYTPEAGLYKGLGLFDFKSLPPHEPVYLKNPDEDFVRKDIGNLENEIEDASDWQTLSFNTDTMQVEWRYLKKVVSHENNFDRLHKFKTETGKTITLTPNHSVYILNDEGVPCVRDAEDIKEDDYLISPKKLDLKPEKQDLNLLELLKSTEIPTKNLRIFIPREVFPQNESKETWHQILKKISEEQELAEIKKEVDRHPETVMRNIRDMDKESLLNYTISNVELTEKGEKYLKLLNNLTQSYFKEGCYLYSSIDQIEPEWLTEKMWHKGFLKIDNAYWNRKMPLKWKPSEEVCWGMGMFIAEGWTDKTFSRAHFSNTNQKLIEGLKSGFEAINPEFVDEEGDQEVRIAGGILPKLFSTLFGRTSENKKISDEIFQLSENQKKSLIEGMVAGDGSESEKSFKYTTSSKNLATDLQNLLLTIGIHQTALRVSREGLYDLRVLSKAESWEEYSGDRERHPLDLIPREYAEESINQKLKRSHRGPRISKSKVFSNIEKESPKLAFFDGEQGLERIKKKEKIDSNQTLYDLSVEGNQNFFAGEMPILVHNSLYPTVMVAHNISPDSLNVEECVDKFELEEFNYSFCQDFQGFFPELVESLIRNRSQIKEEMQKVEKESIEYKSLDNSQKARKTLANSFYGYLGYNGARWYSRECAEATTYLGREYIQETIKKAEEKGYEVVYGDTDSLFIQKENLQEEMDEFLAEVNEKLPKFMELEFEGFFKRGFFTSTDSGEGAKKKYALLSPDGSMKITGFEQVRRDWSPIAKETQKKVLEKVLNEEVEEAAELVKDVIERLKNGEVPPEELRIYTTLTKPPEEYDSTAPHVEAVKKAKERGDDIEAETTISYVITRGSGNISSRAELTKYAEDYDAEYYIENQIIPVSLRVLKVFGYTDGQLQGKGRQSGLGRFN